MKNIFKIIFILSLTIFAVTGCADNSGGSSGNSNTGDINIETIDFDYNASLLNVRFIPKIVGFDEQNITYKWDFGDKSDISESENPTHLYYYSGTYKVVLTVFVNGVEVGSKTQLVTVSGDVTYNIDYDYNANFSKVKFTSKLSGYDEKYITYKWDFGDSSESSSEPNPTHVYETDGTYKVTLTILENGEEKGSKTKIITVSKDKTYNIDFDYTASFFEVQFNPNLSGYDEQNITYMWNFGDGSEYSSKENPIYKYREDGTYKVTLIVLENGVELGSKTEFVTVSRSISYAIDFKYGIYSFEVQFNPNLSGYDKQKITLKWDFGDGSEYSSEANPLYTYRADGTYKVTLTILENGEEKGSKSQYITLNEETYKDFVLTKIIEVDNFVYGETVDGKKYIWGNVGEMGGIGNSEDLTIPKEVTFTVKDTKEYSFIDGATVYVITDVGLYAWGRNDSGQVGNGTTDNVLTPYKVEGIEGNIKEIVYNYWTVYVLTDTGLYAWGNNMFGQVGNGNTDITVTTPNKVEGIDGNIKEVITNGVDTTVYVLTDTGLYAWGANSSGEVGNGNTDNVLTPYKVEGIDGNIKEVITNGSTVYVLTDTGLYAWGNNSHGQVGNGKTDNVLTPHKVAGIEGNIKEIVYNHWTVYVLTDTGLYAWGNNEDGQVGNGASGNNVLTPHKAVNGDIKEFIISGDISFATYYVITDDGLYAWGYNWNGEVGNGTTDNVLTPYKVEGITGTIKKVINKYDTVYVLTDTGLYAWGDNSYGKVGNGNSGLLSDVLTPYKVEGIDGNIKEVITNGSTVYVLTDTGLYAWGRNDSGQVGNGNSGYSSDVLTPYKVEGIDGNIKEVITNGSTVYVLTDTGLYAWGDNSYGQVGNGNSGYSSDVLTPYKVEGIDGNIKEVIANNNTVYVLTDTGLYAWGYNYSGQVGNGTTDNVLTPYKVEGIDGNIKEVITNGSTVYVLTDTGLYAWGNNSHGQVGNGDSWLLSDVLTPYKVKTTHN